MITNKCVCLFLMFMHLVLAMMAIVSYGGSSKVETEAVLCRMIFPLNSLVYFLLNVLLIFLYAGSIVSSSSTETGYYDTVRVFGFILIMFSVYSLILKCLSDMSCEYWSLSWGNVLSRMLQFTVEGIFIYNFFAYYYNKIKVLRDSMVSSAKYLI